MDDCEEWIERLHGETAAQVSLAIHAEAEPVKAMHIDLAMFLLEQTEEVEQACAD